MKKILELKNLGIKAGRRQLVRDINLSLASGEVQAILGPNGAGKSSLVKGIIGLSDYWISRGKVILAGQEINQLSPSQKAKLGLSLIFQFPPALPGVKLSQLLKRINKQIPASSDWLKKELLARDLDSGFSGGEKKAAELLQMKSLKPKALLIDEIDSGLDLVNLKKISQVIQKEFVQRGTAILLITHRGEIMKYLKPKIAHVMLQGRIICSEPWAKVWRTIKKFGYQKCQQCFP